jgi:hypothetical protein
LLHNLRETFILGRACITPRIQPKRNSILLRLRIEIERGMNEDFDGGVEMMLVGGMGST